MSSFVLFCDASKGSKATPYRPCLPSHSEDILAYTTPWPILSIGVHPHSADSTSVPCANVPAFNSSNYCAWVYRSRHHWVKPRPHSYPQGPRLHSFPLFQALPLRLSLGVPPCVARVLWDSPESWNATPMLCLQTSGATETLAEATQSECWDPRGTAGTLAESLRQ